MVLEIPIVDVIRSGGPVMLALLVLSVLMYQAIIGLLLFVRRVVVAEPERGRLAVRGLDGAAADDVAVTAQVEAIEETVRQFKQLVQGRLRYTQALLAAAPLLGLLGTVMGMLDTFRGLSQQLGQETSRAVADGISRALITTETGLMIAIPALFLLHWIKREVQRHERAARHRRLQLLTGKAT